MVVPGWMGVPGDVGLGAVGTLVATGTFVGGDGSLGAGVLACAVGALVGESGSLDLGACGALACAAAGGEGAGGMKKPDVFSSFKKDAPVVSTFLPHMPQNLSSGSSV